MEDNQGVIYQVQISATGQVQIHTALNAIYLSIMIFIFH